MSDDKTTDTAADNSADVVPEDNIVSEAEAKELAGEQEEAKESTEAEDTEAKTEAKAEESEPEAKSEEPEAEGADQPEAKEEAEEAKAEDTGGQDADKERAKRAYRERQQRANTKRQIEKQLDQHYGPASKDQLVKDGYSDVSAEIESLKQEQRYRDERDRIANLNADLQAEANMVLEDFPVFNPGTPNNPNPEYDEDFASDVRQAYENAARVQRDERGIILNADQSIYEFYSRMHRIREGGKATGEQKGRDETVEMLSRSEKPSTGTAPKEDNSEEDLFLKGFNRNP